MTLKTLIAAAGLAFATIGGATAAQADYHPGRHHDRGGRWHDGGHYRSDYRHDRRWHGGWDRGRHHGWDRRWYGHHRRCWWEWRHHHRVRICR
ncbi:hypothetical protein [Flavisphingomonas formosensis]|uniref:hypothetical protein n=1 Tax=Flavisphingomonas formosensis TaxID=861534 RepID=UPI0012FC4B5A|nr:hypothetical protein [Sphingomonas formosensis]